MNGITCEATFLVASLFLSASLFVACKNWDELKSNKIIPPCRSIYRFFSSDTFFANRWKPLFCRLG